MIRYVTIDFAGNVYEVDKLFDQFSKPTKDPVLASTCVIKHPNGFWVPQDADDIPIYTVH